MKRVSKGKSRLLKFLGFGALALVVFLLSAWLLFPYGEVEKRLVTELGKRGIDAEISGLGPRTPFSYSIKALRVTRVMGKDVDLRAEEALVEISPGKLLGGRADVALSAKFMGGTVKAEATVPAPDHVDLGWNGLDILALTKAFYDKEIQLSGKATGNGVLTLPYDSLPKLSAVVSMELTNVVAGPFKVAGFQIDPINLGSGKFKAEAVEGKVKVHDTQLSGGDFGVGLEGTLALTMPLGRSPMDALLSIKPSSKAEKDFFMALSLLTSFKQGDGSFGLRLGGTPSAPTYRSR